MANPPKIGSTFCTYVHGTPLGKIPRVLEWQIPGINGSGVMICAIGDPGFQIEAVYIGAAIGMPIWVDAITAQLGTPLVLTNDLGITYTGVVLKRVAGFSITPAMTSAIPTGVRASLVLEGNCT